MIPSDRVETNVELSRILADLFPLLRSVQPADLNATLNALSTALGGRGEELGETMDKLDAYLGAIDDAPADPAQGPRAPGPGRRHLRRRGARPARDAATTSRSPARRSCEQRKELDVFFGDVAGLANTSTRMLADNEANLIRVGEVTEPMMRLLAVYSPEYPCLLRGLARYQPRLAKRVPRAT